MIHVVLLFQSASACVSCLCVCRRVCIHFVSCAYVASDVKVVEGLLSGVLNEDGNDVTMTPSTSAPAASSVSPSSSAAPLSISLDSLHVVSSHLSVYVFCFA